MKKLIVGISFLSSNFIYQLFVDNPDWHSAIERSYFQGISMLFIIWYPKLFLE